MGWPGAILEPDATSSRAYTLHIVASGAPYSPRLDPACVTVILRQLLLQSSQQQQRHAGEGSSKLEQPTEATKATKATTPPKQRASRIAGVPLDVQLEPRSDAPALGTMANAMDPDAKTWRGGAEDNGKEARESATRAATPRASEPACTVATVPSSQDGATVFARPNGPETRSPFRGLQQVRGGRMAGRWPWVGSKAVGSGKGVQRRPVPACECSSGAPASTGPSV